MDGNSINLSSDFNNQDQTNKGEKEKHSENDVHLLNKDTVDAKNYYPSDAMEEMHPSMNSASENGSELRRRRDDLNYPPNYPTFKQSAVQDIQNPDNHIDISPMDFGFVSDSEDDTEETDEFHDKPSFRGVIEWIMCLLFDCFLLILEVSVNLWLASSLYDNNLSTPYTAIMIILFVPCLINPVLWLKLKSSYKFTTCLVFVLLMLPPSPLFLYIWHLYLSMFLKKSDADKAKSLSDKFRIIQAFLTSVPLMLLNVITLINALKVEGHEVLDISYLAQHLTEVRMHGFAFIVSFINLLRASSLYNERESFTLLFVLVGCPFLLLTALSRILSLGIIIAFLDVTWITILILGLIFGNIALYMVCRKRNQQIYYGTRPTTHLVPVASAPVCIDDVDHSVTIVGRRQTKSKSSMHRGKYLSPITNTTSNSSFDPELEKCGSSKDRNGCPNNPCCGGTGRSSPDSDIEGGRNKSYTYSINPESSRKGKSKPAGTIIISNPHETSIWNNMPSSILLSTCSIVMPSGYSNDSRFQHPRLKGGLFLMLNFFITNLVLGVALGFSILRHVPNTFKGVQLPSLAAKIKIPSSNLNVDIGGINLGINLDGQNVNLGGMPPINTDINLDTSDHLLAVIAPLILTMMVLPFATMRAAMMELDCFIARRKTLADLERVQRHKRISKKKKKLNQQYASTPTTSSGHSSTRVLLRNNQTLVETVAKNTENKELKGRMYVTLLCSIVGMAIMTFVSMFLGVLIYISMHKLS